jgi:hypothetical protein
MFALDFGWRTEQKQLMEAMKTGGPKDWPSILKALAGEGDAQRELRDKAKRGLTELNDALERFSQFMIECLVCFKNPAYAAEDEWRLIVFGRSKPNVNFRVGRGCPLPYIELDLTILDGEHRGKLPISGINYGPVHESAMVKRALRTCLEAMGYDHVTTHVNQSKVPYRG